MSMTMNPLDAFLSSLRSEDERNNWSCSVYNRGRKPCQGKNLYHVGSTRMRICRKHKGNLYDPALEFLQERLVKDHKDGLHGDGDDRKVFAETHEDTSGHFTLTCGECIDDMASEELGVDSDQVEEALKVKQLMEAAQSRYDKVISSFQSYWDGNNHAYAVEHYGESIITASARRDLFQRVLRIMEADQVNMVVAYDKVRDEQRSKLIRDQFSSDIERTVAAAFVREDRYW